MRPLRWFGGMALMALLATRPAAAADPAERDRSYQAAAAALKAGNLDAAAPLLETAAKDCPASLLVAAARGYLAEQRRQPAAALAEYRYGLILFYARPQPDATESRVAETLRARLRELAPGSAFLLAQADDLAVLALTLREHDVKLCGAGVTDLRQLALGQVEVTPTFAPLLPEGKLPMDDAASGSAREQALGYPLSGDLRVRDHPDARKFAGHWYKVFPERVPWAVAYRRCKDLGGFLATVNSQAEHDMIVSMSGRRELWLGGTDARKEGQWEWITGEAFPFQAWDRGQPDNRGGGGEDRLCYVGRVLAWRDQADAPPGIDGFVCEWDR